MFGLSFGEVVLLCLIGLVVVGPRNLPQMMRQLGKTVSKVRRLTTEIREQSGIDEILRAEGIEREVAEIKKLATGRIMEIRLDDEPSAARPVHVVPPRSREYPTRGPDSYGALPDDAEPYLPPDDKPAPSLSAPEGERVARGRAGLDVPEPTA